MHSLLPFFLLLTPSVYGQSYSYEDAGGSYSIGDASYSEGEIPNSVLALLTKANSYTEQDEYAEETGNEEQLKQAQHVHFESSTTVLKPHLEILQLVESFIRLKKEFLARMGAIVADNADLFVSIVQTVIAKIGKLHTFTLIGIKILRKVLEFAFTLVSQWQKPAVSVSGQVSSLFF